MIFLHFMQAARLVGCLGGALLCTQLALAQTDDDPTPVPAATEEVTLTADSPLDDITERHIVAENRPLAYSPIREADILWEKRIWRVVDTREKMNKPFVSPESPFFELIRKAALAGELPVYSIEDDRFSKRLSTDDLYSLISKTDTIIRFDVETYSEDVMVVHNDIDWEQVKRFRIKESWFFDKNMGCLRVRILGIAPLIDEVDDEGNFKYERPLFWVHYPTARPLLAQHKVVNWGGNVSAATTWEDWLEMRCFSALPIKENNIHDRRLQDYLSGTDLAMEAQKIDDRLFNAEHDLWSY